MNTREEMLERVGLLVAAFPIANLTQKTMDVYMMMLADIPIGILDVAIQQLLTECRFLPSIAEIRDRAVVLSSPEIPTAAEAWEQVSEKIRKFKDGDPTPKFTHDLITRTVKTLDWYLLRTSSNAWADRAQFIKIYDQLRMKTVEQLKLLSMSNSLKEGFLQLSSGGNKLKEINS